jgi:ATP-dependent Clp protease ATP-binding subunit ClpX
MFKRRHLCCSFCGKKDTEISKLVAGPRVYICDECVAVVNRIMESDSSSSQPPKVEASVWGKLLLRARQLLRGDKTQRASIIALSE